MVSDFVPTQNCNDKGTVVCGFFVFRFFCKKTASKMRAGKWDVTSNIFMGFSLGGHALLFWLSSSWPNTLLVKGTDKKVSLFASGWGSVHKTMGGVFRPARYGGPGPLR